MLTPGPVTGPIKNIMWKHNGDIAAEWFGAEVAYYRQFKGTEHIWAAVDHTA